MTKNPREVNEHHLGNENQKVNHELMNKMTIKDCTIPSISTKGG